MSSDLKQFLISASMFGGWSAFALLADVGTEMTGLPKLPRGVRRAKLGRCYHNATRLTVRHGLRYVEGYATRANLGVPMEHAWNLDVGGRVVDSTWHDTAESNSYVGVEIPEHDVHLELVRLRHYGVLFTHVGLNIELVRRLWPHALPARLGGTMEERSVA